MPIARHYAGLDAVRVLAITFVTLQHIATPLADEMYLQIGGISIGQYGVAIFLFLSGFLASQSRRPPLGWLAQRLGRLLPAYWIAMAACFALAAAAGHKPFDAPQVLSQMAGLGFWTHRDKLINSPTWFVSVLLVCYLATFLARLVHAERVMVFVAIGVFVALAIRAPMPRMDTVYLTYALGSALALTPPRLWRRGLLGVTVALGIAGYATHPEFFAVAFAVGTAAIALEFERVPALITVMAKYTYEYFLVHGVCLYAAIRKIPENPPLAIAVGIFSAAIAAVALQWLTERLLKLLSRDPDPLRRKA